MIGPAAAFFYFLATTILLIPYHEWLLTAWLESPLDREGRYQFILGILAVAVTTFFPKPANMPMTDFKAWPMIMASFTGYLIASWININSLAVIFALLTAWSLVWLIKGTRIAVVGFGFTSIAILGAPTVTYLIDLLRVRIGLSQIEAIDARRIVTIFIIILLPLLYLFARRVSSLGHKGRLVGYMLSLSILMGALVTAQRDENIGPTYLLNSDRYAFSDWIGADIELTPGEARLFSESNYLKRIYSHRDGSSVAFLKVIAENVHDIHTPEYCWTGSGWQVIERNALNYSPENRIVPAAATQLRLRQGNEELEIVYWFSNGEHSTGEISNLRLLDKFSGVGKYNLQILTGLNSPNDIPIETIANFISQIGGSDVL